MNANEIKFKATVEAWQQHLSETATKRRSAKDALLASLKREDETMSWEQTLAQFDKLREYYLSQQHAQGRFWYEHFTDLKKFVSRYLPAILGRWLQENFFPGSRLRRALESVPQKQIEQNKWNFLEHAEGIEQQCEDLTLAAQTSDLEALLGKIEESKSLLGFAKYCDLLADISSRFPEKFINYYQNKLERPYDNPWQGTVLHYWAHTMINVLMPKNREIYPKLYTALKILLAFTQGTESNPSLSSVTDVLKEFEQLQERLNDEIEKKGYKDIHVFNKNITGTANRLDLPLYLMSHLTVNNRETEIIAEALGRAIVFEIARTSSQHPNSRLWEAQGYGTRTLTVISNYCELNNERSCKSNGYDQLKYANPFHTAHKSVASCLSKAEFWYTKMAYALLKQQATNKKNILLLLPPEMKDYHELSKMESIWLHHRLQGLHRQLQTDANNVNPVTLDNSLKLLKNIIDGRQTLEALTPEMKQRSHHPVAKVLHKVGLWPKKKTQQQKPTPEQVDSPTIEKPPVNFR